MNSFSLDNGHSCTISITEGHTTCNFKVPDVIGITPLDAKLKNNYVVSFCKTFGITLVKWSLNVLKQEKAQK